MRDKSRIKSRKDIKAQNNKKNNKPIKAKKQGKTKNTTENPKVRTLGVRRKTALFCWLILILSVVFGVYKNFTAIDKHTIHERQIVKAKIIDTNAISTFVTDFAKIYYTWEPNHEVLDNRQKQLNQYMMESLVTLNSDSVRSDIPTKSTVNSIKIWQVKHLTTNQFRVLFSLQQSIETGTDKDKKSKDITATYSTVVMQNTSGDMVIVKNPTIAAAPTKARVKESIQQSDSTLDTETIDQINKFLTTFFTLYPKGTANELKYYVKDGTKPINKNYRFAELINPTFHKQGDNIKVDVTVKYIDIDTDMTQLSQYTLLLKKADNNWVVLSGI
ncbi:conjugal transfer protein [Lapidilactobacillus mulanensis]|uniref:Conjugal transfer protein n=2 Tax=Lactobacillaceae TaxID=33958 RepID=A0ABW4DJD5_9LACO|nr:MULTISPECIES: conjugal transfer protein [Lactobacillaceae]